MMKMKNRKAIDFIGKNVRTIEDSVESNKEELKSSEENKSIDVSLEIEAIVNKI